MPNYRTPFISGRFLLAALPIAMMAPMSEKPNGDASFQGDRRPGILEEATDVPTGENALLYKRLGKLRPDELLELLSETPSDSTN